MQYAWLIRIINSLGNKGFDNSSAGKAKTAMVTRALQFGPNLGQVAKPCLHREEAVRKSNLVLAEKFADC